jgi:hypothetical protein
MSHGMRRPDACQWTATTTHGIDTVDLTVKGVCQEPTPGFKLTLTRFDVPSSDASNLILVLTVVPPTGIEPQHVTPTSVEYHQRFVIPRDHVPKKVTIFEAATTVDINAK